MGWQPIRRQGRGGDQTLATICYSSHHATVAACYSNPSPAAPPLPGAILPAAGHREEERRRERKEEERRVSSGRLFSVFLGFFKGNEVLSPLFDDN